MAIIDSLKQWVLDGTSQDILDRYASLPEAAEKTNFGEYDENIIVLDTETTGVSINKDELTQIAAARLVNGEITEWYVTFVNPGKPIPEDIVSLTHITDEDVSSAPDPDQALEGLVNFIGTAKIVAHNAYFDRNFTTNHPAGYPLLDNQWIDSLELSRIALPRMKSHRLIDLVKAFDAPLSTHRADDDVLATCSLYRILLAGIDTMPESILSEIDTFYDKDTWPFGEIFHYFAERKLKVRNDAESNTDSNTPYSNPLPEHFSLEKVRQSRIKAIERKAKDDAGTMFTQAMIEQLVENGANLASIDGKGPKIIKFPTSDELKEAFSAQGIMGKIYADYESRPEQLEMALAVKDAFEESKNLMVEAGTGTGKSMAYLLPAAIAAKNNNISIGIATKTNALLDQLTYKELPALKEKALPDLTFSPIKGYTHYPCLLKIQRILKEGPKVVSVLGEQRSQAPALAALISYIEQTTYDDIDSLKIDYRALSRQSITTTSNDCLRRRCPFYGDSCFVHGSRHLAECADIVVTNHSLLFYDAAANNSLLPPIKYWIVDEAHGAEEEARRALSHELSVDSLNYIIRRISSEDPKTNVYMAATRVSKFEGKDDTLFQRLVSKASSAAAGLAETVESFSSQASELLYFDTQKKSSYERFDLWINKDVRESSIFVKLNEYADEMTSRADKVINTTQELVALLDDVKGAGFAQRELASVALELKEIVNCANILFTHPSESYVYSVTLNRRDNKKSSNSHQGKSPVFHAYFYNIGSELDETLYATTRSIIYTSATLTINGSFDYFAQSVGLNESEQSQAASLKLNPCFDFDNNMSVYVISDMPEPTNPSYLEKLQQFLIDAHLAQGGSMLTLFTNKKDMDKCFAGVSPLMEKQELRLVCQRYGVSSKWLADEFIANETLSLFALKSFWEGFDAPGATLKGVIIPKLPFQSPTDPLSMERKFRDDQAWKNFDLPKAVIEVRQAAGRLIRKASDSGVLILADSRLLSKWYGRVFTGSLPSNDIRVLPSDEIISQLSLR